MHLQRRTHFRSRNNWVCNFWSWTIEHKRQWASSMAGIADNWFYETMKNFFILSWPGIEPGIPKYCSTSANLHSTK